MIDRIVDGALDTPTLVLGTWNQASPVLFEWRLLQRLTGSVSNHGPLEFAAPSARHGSAERIMRRLRGAEAPGQIVLLEVDTATAPSPEWAAAFASEIAWLEPVRRELEQDALPYVAAPEESFAAPGYTVRLFRFCPECLRPS
jgi:hypothetical protein